MSVHEQQQQPLPIATSCPLAPYSSNAESADSDLILVVPLLTLNDRSSNVWQCQDHKIISVPAYIQTHTSNIYLNKRVHSCASYLLNAVISLLAARIAILLDNVETCCLLKLPLKGRH